MKSAELRRKFLEFFSGHDHEVVASSPLVPANDPTLLFTNAGMVQFKDVFLGKEHRPYRRAASSQRCVRAGGKHNDLENVGYTARHHTFFEMLGNFSFGDYFKREAIQYAWEFITGVLAIPKERLWVTVYLDDDEAADIWLKEVGVDPKRFGRLGKKDNFWSMGDTGPCGPCTEIFYDHGPEVSGGPPGSQDEDGDRFVEIWNLVFMQFDQSGDGEVKPLPAPSVDTGMGLERISAVMQGVHSNYDIDLFAHLIDAAQEITGAQNRENNSLKVIADHIRACAFLIVDGVLPSNEGRGYVLRRIIRRALRHGYQLGVSDTFFHKLVAPLERQMGEAFPELSRGQGHAEKVLLQEEKRFEETLAQGMKILEESIAALSGRTIPGETVFKLYDTYGFPMDLTADIARERGLKIDRPGFDEAMDDQRKRARAASKFGVGTGEEPVFEGRTGFSGYERLAETARIMEIRDGGGESVERLSVGELGIVVLERTPFYAESGGQVGDVGRLQSADAEFEVKDTKKYGEVHGHIGVVVGGEIKVGGEVEARVDEGTRAATVLNHSATHLLHAALRTVLGEHVTQKGSLVAPDRLRFDFSHYEPVRFEQLRDIEAMVNEQIRGNADAEIRTMTYDDAISAGALALFGEKYGDEVRVLRLAEFSTELCGGTHVRRAGDIGLFKITSESGIAAGVRRIEAVTGSTALEWVNQSEFRLRHIAEIVKSGRDEVDDKVRQLVERNRSLEKEISSLKGKLAGSTGVDIAEQALEVDGIKVLAARLDGADAKVLRETADKLKQRLGSAVVVLGSVEGDKVRLVAGVTKDTTSRIKAGELIGAVAEQVGGRGGGRPDMAQAGGNDPTKLDDALASVPGWVSNRLAAS